MVSGGVAAEGVDLGAGTRDRIPKGNPDGVLPDRREEFRMERSEERRARLAELLDLAQTYKGSTRKDLAKSLGRDPTKLIPGSGIPKLDLVVDLARVLDWPVDDVVSYLWNGAPSTTEAGAAGDEDFDTLDQAAREAHRGGRCREMIEFAERALAAATTPEQRARAWNRVSGGWDGLGRYTNVLTAVQKGLRQSPVSAEFRRQLQSNLANAYYALWSLVEARAVAADLLAWYQHTPPRTIRDRKTHAYALYIAGNTRRRLIMLEPEQSIELAAVAKRDLEGSRSLYTDLAEELGDDALLGIANTCHGGIIELDVELGERTADSALTELKDGLDDVLDAGGELVGDQLESFGWWCIFGCNLALRHLTDDRQLQQNMAVFTNKADEIGERLDNWSLRERVFTMEHTRWERAVGSTGFDIPRVVDEEDVRVIAGTMARFPSFHRTGWEILRSAKIVRSS